MEMIGSVSRWVMVWGLVFTWCPAMGTSQTADSTTDHGNATRTQVMVLGTFHFAQVEPADDMLSTQRQKEIEFVLDCLEEFKPDKIFVERNPEFEYQNKLGERYQRYLKGESKLSANEIYQVGFRLAKRLGHNQVYQADHPGMYGAYYGKVHEYAEVNDQLDILEGKVPGTTLGLYKSMDVEEYRKSHSLIDFLIFLNSQKYEEADHGWYTTILPRIGDSTPHQSDEEVKDDDEYFIGAKMLADWYRRNIMIYSKVLTQMSFQEEKILVIFGAGHSSTLKHLFESHPHMELVNTAEWLAQKKTQDKKQQQK